MHPAQYPLTDSIVEAVRSLCGDTIATNIQTIDGVMRRQWQSRPAAMACTDRRFGTTTYLCAKAISTVGAVCDSTIMVCPPNHPNLQHVFRQLCSLVELMPDRALWAIRPLERSLTFTPTNVKIIVAPIDNVRRLNRGCRVDCILVDSFMVGDIPADVKYLHESVASADTFVGVVSSGVSAGVAPDALICPH